MLNGQLNGILGLMADLSKLASRSTCKSVLSIGRREKIQCLGLNKQGFQNILLFAVHFAAAYQRSWILEWRSVQF